MAYLSTGAFSHFEELRTLVYHYVISYAFIAIVSPITATKPITHTWTPDPADGQGMETASYSWESSGDKRVTVTVENVLSTVPAIGVHDIVIASGYEVYLPLVLKN